jgi:hypothetical protein
MKLTRLISIAVMLVLLVSACSKKKMGTVTTLILEQTTNEMLAHVKLDDGTEAIALPKVFSKIESGTKWELVKAGQRVELEPASDEELKNSKAKWKIVRIVEAGK